ncbi:MAG: DUF484 family protein [Pseudomonadota bacterium]
MNPSNPPDATEEPSDRDVDEALVLAYLRQHPDLLVRHPALLGGLELPHGVRDAESLLEHQARRLREQNQELRDRLSDLVSNARDNESVNRRLQSLAVALLGAGTASDTFAEIYQCLTDGFRASSAAIRIYGAPAAADARGCGEFVGPDGAVTDLLRECMQDGSMRLGPLDAESLQLLFSDQAERVLSAALVGLRAPRVRGVLAIGSDQAGRFEASAGTVFLEHLGALVSQAVARFDDARY